jgi:hypothetical protein
MFFALLLNYFGIQVTTMKNLATKKIMHYFGQVIITQCQAESFIHHVLNHVNIYNLANQNRLLYPGSVLSQIFSTKSQAGGTNIFGTVYSDSMTGESDIKLTVTEKQAFIKSMMANQDMKLTLPCS